MTLPQGRLRKKGRATVPKPRLKGRAASRKTRTGLLQASRAKQCSSPARSIPQGEREKWRRQRSVNAVGEDKPWQRRSDQCGSDDVSIVFVPPCSLPVRSFCPIVFTVDSLSSSSCFIGEKKVIVHPFSFPLLFVHPPALGQRKPSYPTPDLSLSPNAADLPPSCSRDWKIGAGPGSGHFLFPLALC